MVGMTAVKEEGPAGRVKAPLGGVIREVGLEKRGPGEGNSDVGRYTFLGRSSRSEEMSYSVDSSLMGSLTRPQADHIHANATFCVGVCH